jgi:pimeloyl-ACP methyl ester carboxylesterase
MRRWPVAWETVALPSEFGSTRVHAAGPADAPPLVLLHGGRATAASWFAVVGQLAERHRVLAVEQMGDAGYSRHDGRPLQSVDDLIDWLCSVLDGLGVSRAAVAGHSYGAWLALQLALARPERVSRLALLDPTDCTAGMRLMYRLRALPVLALPSAQRMRNFLAWETRGVPLDPAWLDLAAVAGGEVVTSPIVMPRRPTDAQLRACETPVLQVLAGRSRALDPGAARRSERLLPWATTVTLPEATHHTIPTRDADEICRAVLGFLR